MAERVTRRTVVAALAALAGCTGADGSTGAAGTSTPGDASTGAATTTDAGITVGSSTTPDGGTTGTAGGTATGDDLSLTSPAFEDGGSIPREYGRGARNVNPPLTIRNVPAAAASLTLVVDDPDAVEPAGHVWLHWLVWNVSPARTAIPEGWEPTDAVEGVNDFGERGYDGPAPPDRPHTYRFRLFALETTLDLGPSASERDVEAAMEGAVLARATLRGTYAP